MFFMPSSAAGERILILSAAMSGRIGKAFGPGPHSRCFSTAIGASFFMVGRLRAELDCGYIASRTYVSPDGLCGLRRESRRPSKLGGPPLNAWLKKGVSI